MEAALEGEAGADFEQPEGVVKATVCVPSGKLPTEYCGKTIEDLFAADSLPKEKDNWWQPFKIDIRNGLLATEMTPPQFVQERVFLVLPPEAHGLRPAAGRGVGASPGRVPRPHRTRATRAK